MHAAALLLACRLGNGAMVYHSNAPRTDSKPWQRRLSFTPLSGHRVRQFSEGTGDGGKTWSTECELIYVLQGAPFSGL